MKVFISSTFRDLEETRENLHKSLKKAGIESLGMEFFVAESNTPKEVCLREVDNANLILLIVTDNYGSIDPETGKSFTHLEFNRAKDGDKEILAFLQKDPNDINVKSLQDEIKDSEVTPDYFDSLTDIPDVFWPALLNFVITKGLIPNKTKTFNDFMQFYARSFQKDSLFNYNQKLIGRTDELFQLEKFLSDEDKKTTVINAVGGIGKSRLIYEFSKKNIDNREWNFRFVPWQVGFDNESITELPAQKTCIIIEDAHKQNNLAALIYNVNNNFPYDIKIIISTRPSGMKAINESLREYNPADTINLNRLSLDESLELAKSILTGEKQRHAQAICRAASGNTLVIVMASELIQNDRLDGTLIENSAFREKVLDRILVELGQIESRGVDLKELLATIAGIAPLAYEPNTFELLSKSFNIEKHVLGMILDDFQKYGYIVRIGNRLRVVPDILADYILLKHSINLANEPTGFIDALLDKYGNSYLNNLLINVSELEYHAGGRTVNLSECIWTSIDNKTKNCSLKNLCSVLETIKPVAYYAPEKVYNITNKVMKGEIVFTIDQTKNRDSSELRRIINLIISMLEVIGRRPEVTKRACLELWKIFTEQSFLEYLDKFSEDPSSSFKKLVSFDNHNWFSVQKEAMEAVKEIIETNKSMGYEHKLCEIIDASLKPEIENQGYSMRSFSLSWFCVYDTEKEIRDKVAKARNDAFELYSLLIDKAKNTTLFAIAEKLIQKLKKPYLRRDKLSEKAKAEFEREANIAKDLLKKIINKSIPILNNCIYELISDKREKLLGNIDVSDIISESMKSEYDIYYCIRHDFPRDYDDNFAAADKRFQDKQEQTAKQLWKKFDNDPNKLLDFILNYRDTLKKHGITHGDYTFLNACAKVKPELCSQTVDIIIEQNKEDYIATMISTWLTYGPENEQKQMVKRIIKKGNTCHRTSLAQSLSVLQGLTKNELVKVIEDLSKDSEQKVVDATIGRLGIVCYHRKIKDELPKVVDIICNYEVQDDPDKLEALLNNFNPHWLAPEILSDEQILRILEKVKNIKRLDSQHDTGAFLSFVITKKPLECVRLFLWRIQNMTSDDAQPFPYNEGFHEKPENLVSHTEYKECILEILIAMKEYDWRTYFWCPTVIRWMDPLFSDVTKIILLDNIKLHSNALRAITYIFVDYERKMFFNNVDFVNTLLVQASQLQDEKTSDQIYGKLSFMPFSGTRYMSGLGEPDDLSLDIIKKCEKLLNDHSDFPEPISKFYHDLIEYAKHENQRKINKDKAELAEEEF